MAINASTNIDIKFRLPNVRSWLYRWALVLAVRLKLITADKAIKYYQRWLFTCLYYRIAGSEWVRIK